MKRWTYRKFKYDQGCRLARPCILCRYRIRCLEEAWDNSVIVLNDGTHAFSREEARKRGLLDALGE